MTDELSLDEIDSIMEAPKNLGQVQELTLDDLDALDSMPEPQKKTGRSKKDPTEDRTIGGWMKLVHTFDHACEVPSHDETRPRNKGAHYRIGEVWVCRICYLSRADQT